MPRKSAAAKRRNGAKLSQGEKWLFGWPVWGASSRKSRLRITAKSRVVSAIWRNLRVVNTVVGV